MATLVTTTLERLRRRDDHTERGDTLIELLIAIVIIALTVTALLGALVTAITSSTTQKSLSTIDAVLNTFAQSAQYEAQQSFVNCTPTPYRLISAPIPSSAPAGAAATVFVTGFTANHILTVKVGSATANTTPSIVSTDGSGDAAITFRVPSGLSGAQAVAVSDGTSASSPTQLVVGGTTKATTPTGYSISVNPVQQWDAQSSSWVAASSGTCPNSGAQQITAFAQGPAGASGTLSFVVLHSATTTVLVSTSWTPQVPGQTSPILGDTLTFTAKVIPPNSTTPAPTGSIQWSFAQSPTNICGNGTNNITSLGTVSGSNTSQATCTVTNAGVGTYEVTATYPANGTTGNYGGGSGSGSITVGAANSSTVLTTSWTPSSSPAQPGSTLSFKATIGASPANANDLQPSGAVVWTITAPSGTAPTCSQGGDTQHMTSSTTGTNSTTCSFTLPTTAPTGTYSASASYQGDGNYNPSASSSPATIGVSTQTPTLSFSTSPQNPQTGQSFTVTVTVNGNGSLTPTGTVNWTVTAPSGTNPTCAQSTLVNGQASCKVNNSVTGTYTVAATYNPTPGTTAYGTASGSTQPMVTLPPAALSIATIGSPADNKPDSGDKIVYTYNQAMSLNSIMNGLALNTPVSVSAVFTRSTGATSLTIQCTGFRCNNPNLGTASLGDSGSSHYIAGGFFGNTVTLSATMTATANAGGQTVITIALTQTNPSISAVPSPTTVTWTPNTAATNPGGVNCAPTAVTETGPNF